MQCHIMDEGMTLMAANQKLSLGNTQSSKDSISGSSENCIFLGEIIYIFTNGSEIFLLLCHAIISLHSGFLKKPNLRSCLSSQNYPAI